MSRTVRLASFAAAAVVLLVALGLGVNALVERIGRENSVVMIADDPMSPGSPGTPGQGSAAADGSPADALSGGSPAIDRDQAIEIARSFETKHPHVVPTDTAPPGVVTTADRSKSL